MRPDSRASHRRAGRPYLSSQDLVNGGTFLQGALSHHLGPHLLHIQHEGIQRLFHMRLLLLLLFHGHWGFSVEACGYRLGITTIQLPPSLPSLRQLTSPQEERLVWVYDCFKGLRGGERGREERKEGRRERGRERQTEGGGEGGEDREKEGEGGRKGRREREKERDGERGRKGGGKRREGSRVWLSGLLSHDASGVGFPAVSPAESIKSGSLLWH